MITHIYFMLKAILRITLYSALALTGIVMGGCQDHDFGYDVSEISAAAFKAAGLFDFAMTHDVNISIDFNAPGSTSPVWIYDQNPYDEEGDLIPGVKTLYAFFLEDGAYRGTINLPTATSKVWIATGGMGLPTLTEVNVENNEVVLNASTRAMIPVGGTVTDNYVGILSTTDYQVKRAGYSGFELIEKTTPGAYPSSESTRTSVYNKIHALYPWSISGKPLASSSSSNTPISEPLFEQSMYYNNIGSSFSITTGSWEQIKNKTGEREYLKNLLTISTPGNEWTQSFTFYKRNDGVYNQLTINDNSAGTLRVYVYNSNKDLAFKVDNATDRVTYQRTYCGNKLDYFDITFSESAEGNNHIVEAYNTCGIVCMVYTKADGSQNYCSFADGNLVQSETGFFTFNDTDASLYKNLSPAIDYLDDCHYALYFQKDDSNGNPQGAKEIKIADKTAGTIKFYIYGNDKAMESYYDYVDSKNTGKQKHTTDANYIDNVYVLEHTFATLDSKEYHTITPNNGRNILYMEYTYKDAEGNDVTHYCKFNENGIYQDQFGFFTIDGSPVSSGFIKSAKQIKNTLIETEPIYTTQKVTYSGNDYDYCLNLKNSSFTVTVPAGIKARLTMFFSETTLDNAFKIDGNNQKLESSIFTYDIDAKDEQKIVTVSGNSKDIHLYYASVEKTDWYQATNTTNEVYTYRNINDQSNQSSIYNNQFQGFVNRLQNTLWRGTGSKANAKSTYGDYFNQKYASTESNKSDIKVTAQTELFVTFVGEYDAFSANTFGYYVYPTDRRPTTIDEIDEMYIIFPNCTSSDYSGSRLYKRKNGSNYDYSQENLVPLKCGDQVQLVYKNSNGEYVKDFPAGVSVGWFVIYNGFDGWDLNNNTTTTGHVRLGALNNNGYGRTMMDTKIYFADPALNFADPLDKGAGSTRSRCVQLTDKKSDGTLTGFVALCFEDSYSNSDGHSGAQDKTYDDLIFTIKASNTGDINNPSNQYTDGDEDKYISYREEGIYAFEDIWDGSATDFDMNDVAVSYNRTYSIKYSPEDRNTHNHITKVEEVYTVLNDGATYHDAFAVRLPYTTGQISKINYTDQDGNTAELNTAVSNTSPYLEEESDGKVSIILFNDINAANLIGKVFDFEITFTSPLETTTVGSATDGNVSSMTSGYNRAAYDPFIIVENYTGTVGKRCEIHMPNKQTTSQGVVPLSQYNANNRWYVAKLDESMYSGLSDDGLKILPFAVDIPYLEFKGCREGIFITTDYPDFFNWAKTSGSSNADWYKNPRNTPSWERKQ